MPVSWHLNRWWNFFLLEDEKKEIESSLILVQMYQNIYLKIFKTICSNISCITKISKPKCFNPFSIKLLCSFLEIALWHACSPVNLLHIIRTPFPYNSPGGLLPALRIIYIYIYIDNIRTVSHKNYTLKLDIIQNLSEFCQLFLSDFFWA